MRTTSDLGIRPETPSSCPARASKANVEPLPTAAPRACHPRAPCRPPGPGEDAVGAGAAASLFGLAGRHPDRHGLRDRDEPRGAVAAENHPRQCRWQPQGAGMAGGAAHLGTEGQQDGAGRRRGHHGRAHRGGGRHRQLHRQLLHGERSPVGGLRPALAGLRPSPATVAGLLRHASDRQHPVQHHRRREDDPGVRLLWNAGYSGGPPDAREPGALRGEIAFENVAFACRAASASASASPGRSSATRRS